MFPFDERGRWPGPDPRAGDALQVFPSEWAIDPAVIDAPFRFALDGDAPCQVAPSANEVCVDVRSAIGGSIPARVVFDDHAVDVYGNTAFRRVAPGSRPVWISAPDHQTASATLTVPERRRTPGSTRGTGAELRERFRLRRRSPASTLRIHPQRCAHRPDSRNPRNLRSCAIVAVRHPARSTVRDRQPESGVAGPRPAVAWRAPARSDFVIGPRDWNGLGACRQPQ